MKIGSSEEGTVERGLTTRQARLASKAARRREMLQAQRQLARAGLQAMEDGKRFARQLSEGDAPPPQRSAASTLTLGPPPGLGAQQSAPAASPAERPGPAVAAAAARTKPVVAVAIADARRQPPRTAREFVVAAVQSGAGAEALPHWSAAVQAAEEELSGALALGDDDAVDELKLSAVAHSRLGSCLVAAGDPAAAKPLLLRSAQRAMAMRPADSLLLAGCLTLLAKACRALGEAQHASTYLERARRLKEGAVFSAPMAKPQQDAAAAPDAAAAGSGVGGESKESPGVGAVQKQLEAAAAAERKAKEVAAAAASTQQRAAQTQALAAAVSEAPVPEPPAPLPATDALIDAARSRDWSGVARVLRPSSLATLAKDRRAAVLDQLRRPHSADGTTLLMLAAAQCPAEFNSLTQVGGALDVEDGKGDTALVYAVRARDSFTTMQLLNAGASLRKRWPDTHGRVFPQPVWSQVAGYWLGVTQGGLPAPISIEHADAE